VNLLRAATLSVRDPAATAARYADWLGYEVVERGAVEAALAESWGAPAVAGRPYVVCRPASGAEVFLRFVAADPAPDYRPLRSHGWAAIEISVQDTLAVAARMAESPFEIIGPPRELDGMPEIFPMQVKGPDDEIVYLTQIRAQPAGVRLAAAASPVDRLFILVLACSDLAAARAWFAEAVGLKVGPEVAIRYTMINKAFDLPIEAKHRIATAGDELDVFLELDQYPDAAVARSRPEGALPPGVAIATFAHADLTTATAGRIAPPAMRAGAIYGGRPAATLAGPDGSLVELVQAG
jgi:catechol 2,3-dioxygenase-like lactoylglutathione lyase family enzyme